MEKQIDMFAGKFFNTNQTSPEQMVSEKQKALSQEQIVLNVFKRNLVPLNASTVWKIAFEPTGTLLSSVRRAITNLTDPKYPGGQKLVKTENLTIGMYGKREHYYKLLPNVSTNIQDGTI